MAGTAFKDESAASTVLSGSPSGSLELGAATPSAGSCRCTVDGTDLVLSGFIGPGLVSPGANDRATGVMAGLTHNTGITIFTGKSGYALASATINDGSGLFNPQYDNAGVQSQSVGSFIVFNYSGADGGLWHRLGCLLFILISYGKNCINR